MTTKEQLHQLVEQLPESELATAEGLLAALLDTVEDPVYRMLLDAEEEDEPLTEEDEAAIEEGLKQYREGKVKPLQSTNTAS